MMPSEINGLAGTSYLCDFMRFTDDARIEEMDSVVTTDLIWAA